MSSFQSDQLLLYDDKAYKDEDGFIWFVAEMMML